MDDYKFVRLNTSNLSDLGILFNLSGKNVRDFNVLKLKYNTAYTGVENIGYFAYNDRDEPCAFYGVIPALAKINNRPLVIAQSADTITHPDHQRKGLFVRLAKKTYELAADEGIQFLFGVPNMLSYPGFMKKLEWTDKGNLRNFEIEITNLPLGKVVRNYHLINSIYQNAVKRITKFLFKESSVNEDYSTISEYFIPASESYINYKNYKPKHLIKIDKVVVWLSLDGILKIGEIFTINGETPNFEKIFKKLKWFAFLCGVNKIRFSCSDTYPHISLFRQHFKESEGLPLIIKPLKGQVTQPLIIRMADIDTF